MDKLHRTPEAGEIGALRLPHVFALVEESPACRADEAREQPAGGRLAAAAFANEAHRFPGLERERDLVDGGDRPSGRVERPADAVELDERGQASFSATGSGAFEPMTSATCCHRMQAASCSGVSTLRRGGSASRHASMAYGQRGA